MKINNIGIPRSLYYCKYKDFIKNYFEYLGYNIVLSSKKITSQRNTPRCSIYNTYIEDVKNLKDKCDLIIIPYQSVMKKEEIICPFLENIHTKLSLQINNIFTFNLKYPISIIRRTLKINKNIPKVIVSYILARIDYINNKRKQINRQKELLKSKRKKVLLAMKEYYQLEFSKTRINEYDILYTNLINEKIALDYYKNIVEDISNYSIRIIIGSIYYYCYAVDTIIIINEKKCKYNIKNYLNYFTKDIKKKIIIINI